MKQQFARHLLSVALIVFGAPMAVAQSASDHAAPITLKLKGVDGKTYDVAEMHGQVVVVSFGATWCKPCEWELAALEELKVEYAQRPVRFLWVSVDTKEQASDAWLKQYAKLHNITIPVLRDADFAAFSQFNDRLRLPMIVFFNERGEFAAPRHTGMSADPIEYKQRMRARIDALLKAEAAGAR